MLSKGIVEASPFDGLGRSINLLGNNIVVVADAVYRYATTGRAGAAGQPRQKPLDAGHQPDAGGQMARSDW